MIDSNSNYFVGKTTRFTQTRVIKMVDRSTQKELRKDKKRSHKKSEGMDLKVIKKKKVLSILKKKKHVIQSFLDDEAEKLQKQVAVQSMLSKEAKVVLQTPVINRAMRSRSNSVKSEPGHIASSSRPSSSCSYNYNKPYNYGRSCEACILLKESGKFACQGCQRKSSILNEPPNKVYNYGKTCEACTLLKEQGKYACPACQEKFLLTMYNYGKNCDVCQLFKDSGKYACGRCQKLPNNSKNKSKKNKTEGRSHKKSHKKNKKKKSAASVESISLNEDNQATTSENNNEDNIEVENDDDEDDEFIEYVSLRDLLNGNEK